jgi:membrane dipeptidase
MLLKRIVAFAFFALFVGGSLLGIARPRQSANIDRVKEIHQKFVFADTHAHPSRFHRANVPKIAKDELERYQRSLIDVVVACVSTDAIYTGNYIERDGTRIEGGNRIGRKDGNRPLPGEPYAFTLDRFSRILKNIEDGDARLASSPSAVLEAKRQGKLALLPALEGADGLEAKIENLRELYQKGLRLLQLVHFRANELGHIQTYPYAPGGLTEFGKEAVRECNRLGILIDLAHANTETIEDTLEVSEHPVLFSHTECKALQEGDRHLTDEEIRAIAAEGGIIGIWPSGSTLPRMEDMIRHIDHVKKLVGVDHVSIGSDLRGMGSYTEGFGEEANFLAIAEGLLDYGYSDEEVGKVMGGNFMRVWEEVTNEK